MSGAGWTSLEIAKFAVAAATPIIVLIAGLWFNWKLKSIEEAQWSHQKIIERRIEAYDEIATPANELFCFFSYVGGWKELTPAGAVQIKRTLDQKVHVNAPLFEPKFLALYDDLMGVFFATFIEWGVDAKLKTHTERRRKVWGAGWDPEWDKCFVDPDKEEISTPDEVKLPYGRFMAYMAEAIGVPKVDEHLLGSGQTPANFEDRAAAITTSPSAVI
jgi:hypothetical protein